METKFIHIEWRGPLKIADAERETDHPSRGLYQIYGGSAIYGARALLYIGMTDGQTFGARIKRHRQDWCLWNQDSLQMQVYLGRLALTQGRGTELQKASEADILDAEKLLIFAHTPARNSHFVLRLPEEKFQHIHVLNWGNHGSLMPEVSGSRWSERFNQIDITKCA